MIKILDEKRNICIAKTKYEIIDICAKNFIKCFKEAYLKHGSFFVALSGGSTPKDVYKKICSSPYKEEIDWSKVYLFWSDERDVPLDDKDSNYNMAMNSGFKDMPIPKNQIFPMNCSNNIKKQALDYEKTIKNILKEKPFDLIILGMGEDGHTASLFPNTEALNIKNRSIIENFVPQKNSWRMTMTFDCINSAKNIDVYIFSQTKKEILKKVLYEKIHSEEYPIQKVGSKKNKA